MCWSYRSWAVSYTHLDVYKRQRLLAATGVDALHFSARRERESGMRFRNPQVSMGGCAGVPEYTLTDADEAFVRQLLAKLE